MRHQYPCLVGLQVGIVDCDCKENGGLLVARQVEDAAVLSCNCSHPHLQSIKKLHYCVDRRWLRLITMIQKFQVVIKIKMLVSVGVGVRCWCPVSVSSVGVRCPVCTVNSTIHTY